MQYHRNIQTSAILFLSTFRDDKDFNILCGFCNMMDLLEAGGRKGELKKEGKNDFLYSEALEFKNISNNPGCFIARF